MSRPEVPETETCSWCTQEVPYTTLKEAKDGSMICGTCRKDPANKEFV